MIKRPRKVLTSECSRSGLYSSILLIRQVVKKGSIIEKTYNIWPFQSGY